MTLADDIIEIALIGIVLFQVRGRQLTTRSLLLPLGTVQVRGRYVPAQRPHEGQGPAPHRRVRSRRRCPRRAGRPFTSVIGARTGRRSPGPGSRPVCGFSGPELDWPSRCTRPTVAPPPSSASASPTASPTQRRGRRPLILVALGGCLAFLPSAGNVIYAACRLRRGSAAPPHWQMSPRVVIADDQRVVRGGSPPSWPIPGRRGRGAGR